jgi:hypothetical protein
MTVGDMTLPTGGRIVRSGNEAGLYWLCGGECSTVSVRVEVLDGQ